MQQKGQSSRGHGRVPLSAGASDATKSVETDLRRKPENRSLHVTGVRRGFADA